LANSYNISNIKEADPT